MKSLLQGLRGPQKFLAGGALVCTLLDPIKVIGGSTNEDVQDPCGAEAGHFGRWRGVLSENSYFGRSSEMGPSEKTLRITTPPLPPDFHPPSTGHPPISDEIPAVVRNGVGFKKTIILHIQSLHSYTATLRSLCPRALEADRLLLGTPWLHF